MFSSPDGSSVPSIAAALLFGYVCGSIPFGLLLTRLAGTEDVRAIGSGNIGATNVLRTGRKDLAAATLFFDAAKGTAAVLVCSALGLGPVAALAAGFGAFIGHIFPVWLKFRGGKGVATFLGVALGVGWEAGLAFAVVWLLTAYASRYSSLAALVASLITPAVFLFLQRPLPAAVLFVMACILWFKHRENIERLAAGRESRIGQSA